LISGGMLIILQISSVYSVHPYNKYQVVGLIMGWIGVCGGFVSSVMIVNI
jgi:hypothetical protein